MKMKKRVIAAVIIPVLAMLCACGNNPDAAGSDSGTGTESKEIAETIETGELIEFRYYPGYSDMDGGYHGETLKKDENGEWIIECRDKKSIDKPEITTIYSVNEKYEKNFEAFLKDNNVASLTNRGDSDVFATDYSPWSYSVDFTDPSSESGKRINVSFGEYKEYSDEDYKLIKKLGERFEGLKGDVLSETVESDEEDQDDTEAAAEESGTSERDEYVKEYDSANEILYKYKEAQDRRYTGEQVEELLGYGEALGYYGWPYANSGEDIGYVFYDVDADGRDELFITYGGEVIDIYGNYDAVMRRAFSAPRVSEVTMYPDGLIKVHKDKTFDFPGTSWYQYYSSLGDYLRVFEESNGEYYEVSAFDLTGDALKEIEESYRNYGYYPEWIGEWFGELTKSQYDALVPKTKPLKLPNGEKLSDLVLPEGYKPSFEPNPGVVTGRVKEIALSGNTQYEVNVFLSNFAEQRSNNGQAYTILKDMDLDDLAYFVFRYKEINSYDDLVPDGTVYTLTLDQFNEVADRFFGISLTDDQAKAYSVDEYSYYRDGVFHKALGDGEAFEDFAVVRKMFELDDGTYEMQFDIYSPSLDAYESGQKDAVQLYKLSPDKARRLGDIDYAVSGTAIVKPYKYKNKNTYQLIRMDVGK